jgi:hypothetical protein
LANIQHSVLTDPNLHEPKGVSTATTGQVYVANGSGTGVWKDVPPTSLTGLANNGTNGQVVGVDGTGNFKYFSTPHGQIDFYNLATPYVLTYPSVFTKLAPTTSAGGVPLQFTEATTARLTYTGTLTVPMSITYSVSLDTTAGANRDIILAIYKNGALTNAHCVVTTQSGNKHSLSGTNTINMATNDYVELYALNNGANGDVRVYAMQLNAIFAGA